MNPFEYQEPLLPGSDRGVLLDRNQRQQALQLLQRGGFLTVSAPPRSGVTTFLHSLRPHLSLTVYLDLANLAFGDDPSREAAQALGRELKGVLPALELPPSAASVADILAVVARAPAEDRQPELTVIADGFDTWTDDASRKLVLALRAAYTEARTAAGRFSVITGSAVDLRDLTSSGRTSPLNIAQPIFLPDFTPAEVATLLKKGLAPLNASEDDIAQWVQRATPPVNGHPALSQMLGSLACQAIAGQRAIGDAWPQALAALREEATSLLGSTLGLLSKRSDLRRTATQIYSGTLVPCDRIHRPIRELIHLGLIRSDEQGAARPRNGLFEQVLAAALNLSAPRPSVDLWPNAVGQSTTDAPPPRDGPESASVQPKSTSHGAAHASTQDYSTPDSRAEPAERAPIKPPLLDSGTVIGGCKVIRRIGRGGMAEVYLARHLGLDTDVALKVMRQHAQQDRRIDQRFLREARAAAQLNHENIVQIRNVGREGEIQFIEMEYLPGGSLAQLLDEAPCKDFCRLAEFLRGAAAGVQAAHAKGIVHRDIKPDNLMLTEEGRIKVVDFGLAAITSLEGSRLTQEGMIIGTPYYMAPEQWDGKPVDERSDIYSLGATFYHLITGHPPFEGRTAVELIRNFSSDDPAPVQMFNPIAPRPLAHAIMRMIERDPADRYASIAELLGDPDGLGSKAL